MGFGVLNFGLGLVLLGEMSVELVGNRIGSTTKIISEFKISDFL